MLGQPTPVRFLHEWLRVPPTIVGFLPMAWHWADQPLRKELQASTAALVRREPALLPVLRARTRAFRAPPPEGLDPQLELAGLLLSIWTLADAPLRTEVERMVRGYSERHSRFGEAFAALIRTAGEQGWAIVPFGRGDGAQAALTALLKRLAP
jgi:hypothetical protein